MSTIINLSLLQNSDFLASFNILDSNNNPINLSSLTIESQMRHQYGTNTAYTFTCTGFANGYLTIQLPASNAIMNASSYVYDVMLRDNSGTLVRLIEGTVKVTPSVTVFV